MATDLYSELKAALEVLKNGGIILYPTDTIWGIGCDATNEKAVDKIYALKKRTDSKSMILLVDNENRIPSYVDAVPDTAWSLIEYSEKPLTIIYDKGKNLPKNVLAEDGSVAIRVTRDEFCKKLLERLRKPLISTSANLSSHPAPQDFGQIDDAIRSGVDYIVDWRREEKNNPSPSTIIRLKGNGEIIFVRK